MLKEQFKRIQDSKQRLINAALLLVIFIIVLSIKSELSQDYNNRVLQMIKQLAELPSNLTPEARETKIDEILKKIPEKLELKKIQTTKGLETIIKLYEMGYTGPINFQEFHNRGRGISSYNDVVEILLTKQPFEKTLLTVHKNYLYQKYLSKHEKQTAIYQNQHKYCIMVFSHIPTSQQNINEIQKIRTTLSSIEQQEYQQQKIVTVVANIGNHSEILRLAEPIINEQFTKIGLNFAKIDGVVNKIKAVSQISEHVCPNSSVIIVLNAADRLLSPFVLKTLDAVYQKNILITSSREIFAHDLSLSTISPQVYKHTKEMQSKILASLKEDGRYSPVRQYNFQNLITFRKQLLNQLIALPKQKQEIKLQVKSSGSENQNISIFQLESPQANPNFFDLSFIYPLVELAGPRYEYISEILYEIGSFKNTKNTMVPAIQMQRQYKILQQIKRSHAARNPLLQADQ